MDILITGGAGNIGSSLVKTLSIWKDVKIVVVDNFLTGRIQNLDLGNQSITLHNIDCNSDDFASLIFRHVSKFLML